MCHSVIWRSCSKLVRDYQPSFRLKTGSLNRFCLVLSTNLLALSAILAMWGAQNDTGKNVLRNTHHVSALTGKPLSGVQIYAPMQHVRSGCHVHVTRDNFQIIGHEKNRYLLELKESIIISTTRPKLNGNIRSVPLHLFSSWNDRNFLNFCLVCTVKLVNFHVCLH